MVIKIKKLLPGLFYDQVYGKETMTIRSVEFIKPDVEVKALSWKQPFAELMLQGKDLETRSWNTDVRGWILICATLKPYEKWLFEKVCGKQLERANKVLLHNANKEINGMAIGIGYLNRVMPLKKYDHPEDRSFVDKEHHPYLYGLEFIHLHRIKPFLFKGGQKWKNLTTDQIKQIEITK